MNLCACGCGRYAKAGNRFSVGHSGVAGQFKGYWAGKKRPGLAHEQNPQWMGGGDKYWQRQALIRDDYTCRVCGLRDPEIMEIDHIIPRSVAPELRHELNNLVTLCPNDHRRKTNREKKAILAAKAILGDQS